MTSRMQDFTAVLGTKVSVGKQRNIAQKAFGPKEKILTKHVKKKGAYKLKSCNLNDNAPFLNIKIDLCTVLSIFKYYQNCHLIMGGLFVHVLF